MKRTILSTLLTLAVLPIFAQLNLQLHYDFGHHIYGDKLANRPHLTATIENFTADRWGSTFLFVDANFADNQMVSTYAELSRELRFWEAPFAVHIEYNGGLENLFSYNDAYLVGAAWNWANQDFSKTFSAQILYKYLACQAPDNRHSCQFTSVWGIHFADGLCTFSGYADLWLDRTIKGGWMLSSEPQFWVNLNALDNVSDDFNLSIGAEVELSRGLVYTTLRNNEKFYAIPTLGLKWRF